MQDQDDDKKKKSAGSWVIYVAAQFAAIAIGVKIGSLEIAAIPPIAFFLYAMATGT